jgi:hypothetical protein
VREPADQAVEAEPAQVVGLVQVIGAAVFLGLLR